MPGNFSHAYASEMYRGLPMAKAESESAPPLRKSCAYLPGGKARRAHSAAKGSALFQKKAHGELPGQK
jgi:hypothetical protein